DVDHFKRVNDERGHVFGDGVLRELSQRVLGTLREVDVAARYGGEEFALLLPHTGEAGALVVAQRIQNLVHAQPFERDGISSAVTVSQGVAASPGLPPEQLVQAA